MRARADGPARPVPDAFFYGGFTLIEVLLVAAVIVTLAGIAIPLYFASVNEARNVRARADIRAMGATIDVRCLEADACPASLADVGFAGRLDPWGNPYQYLSLDTPASKGLGRKDKNLVPINSDYDLYSSGPDGKSESPLTAHASRDDIVRANNGAYVGLAADY